MLTIYRCEVCGFEDQDQHVVARHMTEHMNQLQVAINRLNTAMLTTTIRCPDCPNLPNMPCGTCLARARQKVLAKLEELMGKGE